MVIRYAGIIALPTYQLVRYTQRNDQGALNTFDNSDRCHNWALDDLDLSNATLRFVDDASGYLRTSMNTFIILLKIS